MYADYTYYQTEYGGKMSADDFKRFSRRAERRIDGITGNKLQFAYPTNERSIEAVKDCVCELADFLYQIDAYNAAAMDSMGTVAQADGTVRGKVITSISSGSESIGYSASGSSSTAISEAAKDKKVADSMVYGIVQDGLTGVTDSNGVNLLYAGIPYPIRNAPISRPPEDKPEDDKGDDDMSALPVGSIIIWSGTSDNVPNGWHICDGTDGTPDLTGKFVLGAGTAHSVGETGGEETHKLTVEEIPEHYHTVDANASGTTSGQMHGAVIIKSDGATKRASSEVGGNKSHNNMPPYYTLCYIMKVG